MRKLILLLSICTWSSFGLCAMHSLSHKKLIKYPTELYESGDIYGCLSICQQNLKELEQSKDSISYTYSWFLHTSAICYFVLGEQNLALNAMHHCNVIRKKILKHHDERYVSSMLSEIEMFSALNISNKRDSVMNILLEVVQEEPSLYYCVKSKYMYFLFLYSDNYENTVQYGYGTLLDYQERMSKIKSSKDKRAQMVYSEDIIRIYHVIALCYNKMKDYYSAFLWTREILDIKQQMGLSHSDCLEEYHDIASYSNQMGYCEDAMMFGEYVLKSLENQKNDLYASTAHILASANARCGDVKKAIMYAEEALEIKKQIFGEDTYSYNVTLGNLGAYYAMDSNYYTAIGCAKKASTFYTGNNLSNATIWQNIATYYSRINNRDSAIYYRGLSTASFRKDIIYEIKNMISNSRQVYISYETSHVRTLIWSEKEYCINNSFNCTSYDLSLLIKGTCVGIENKLLGYIKHYGDSSQLAQLYTWKAMQISPNCSSQNIINEELKLLNFSQSFIEDSMFYINITHDIVRKYLKQDEIGVEITYDDGIDTTYIALILRKDWNAPKCVILGNEAELDSMSYPKLQQAVWQAIIDSAQIKEGENIYFSPDGIFYNMPIEYLPTADGRNMSDKYNMFRVSSTRELCYRDTANTYSSAVLYGGLRYDATPQNLLAQNSSTRGWEESIHESVLSQWRADDRAKYNYLPYTLKEVDSISQTIGNAIQVTTYTDKEGSEESFKSLSGHSPSILHIATHGYYITPTKAEMMSKENLYRYGLTTMDDRPSVIDYSMERTGLLMAGAQHTLRGDSILQAAEDGILSAKEISHLDLSNTDLVVLSACQTALGDITNDGVAGLQRGFKIAGVKSVLMSLWKVDDAATYLLMKHFYKSLFAGKNKQQALRDAQNYLRSYTVGNERPYSDIHYWGAFILLDAIEK